MKRGKRERDLRTVPAVLLAVSLLLMMLPEGAARPGRTLVRTLTGPFESAFAGVGDTISGIPQTLSLSRKVTQENRRTDRKFKQLETEKRALEMDLVRTRRLEGLLNQLKVVLPKTGYQVLVTEVTRKSGSVLSGGASRNSITIGIGDRDGVKPDDLVVVGCAVVGKVLSVGPWSSEVRLITDSSCRIVAKTFPEAVAGDPVLEGLGNNRCVLKYVDARETVRPDDYVVTSGFDGTYPSGLLLGKVTKVSRPGGDRFLSIEVTPEADFDRLDQVTVIRRVQPR
jgi:rod shape-determining protein MreC